MGSPPQGAKRSYTVVHFTTVFRSGGGGFLDQRHGFSTCRDEGLKMSLAKLSSVWGPLKTGCEKSVVLSADAIHVHVGVMLLFFFAWVTRRPLHDSRPW